MQRGAGSEGGPSSRRNLNHDGFGIGWYGERARPGVFRDIRPAWSDDNLLSIAHQIRSRLFFAHERASTGTASTRANCHPFAVGERLFMHNVEQEVPDDLFLHRAAQPTVNGERIYAARYATDLEPPTLYTKIRPEGSSVVVVSEPLDKQQEGWTVVLPQQAITVSAEKIETIPLRSGLRLTR